MYMGIVAVYFGSFFQEISIVQPSEYEDTENLNHYLWDSLISPYGTCFFIMVNESIY